MDDVTRRSFVKTSAGAAAGLATLGALGADAEARSGRGAPGTHLPGHPGHAEPIVVYVKDHHTGVIAMMSGDREIIVHDRRLAAQIVRHARH